MHGQRLTKKRLSALEGRFFNKTAAPERGTAGKDAVHNQCDEQKWCERPDSNRHALTASGPKPGASTNFATLARRTLILAENDDLWLGHAWGVA